MEFPVIVGAKRLHVVSRPIVVAHIEFYSHIVDKLIDVEKVAYFRISVSRDCP